MVILKGVFESQKENAASNAKVSSKFKLSVTKNSKTVEQNEKTHKNL